MTPEAVEIKPQREPIKVRLGEAFNISPNLDSFLEDDGSTITVDSVPFELWLETGETKQGSVNIYKDLGLLPGIMGEEADLGILPAGPIVVSIVLKEDGAKEVYNSLPIEIEVGLDGISEKEIKQIRCTLIFDDVPYRGETDGFDEVELEREGRGSIYFNPTLWIAPQTNEGKSLLFPPTQEVFQRMKFVITKID